VLQTRCALASLAGMFDYTVMTVRSDANWFGGCVRRLCAACARLEASGAQLARHSAGRDRSKSTRSRAAVQQYAPRALRRRHTTRAQRHHGRSGAYLRGARDQLLSYQAFTRRQLSRWEGQRIQDRAVSLALQKNRSLLEIDFRYKSHLGLAGADAVLDAKAPLRRLNLLNTLVGVSKARQLPMLDLVVDTLCGLHGDEQVFLAPRMALASGDAMLLAAEVSRNGSRLITMDLSRNQLTDDALEALTRVIKDSKHLSTLKVGGNSFTRAVEQELEDAAHLKNIALVLTWERDTPQTQHAT
jgi:hypothetical protein